MRAEHRTAAAYELGVLDDAEEFETHLRGCPRCRELLAELHPVTEALDAAVRLGYLPNSGGPAGGFPAPGEVPASGAGLPASGGSSAGEVPASGPGLPASGGSSAGEVPTSGPGLPASGGSSADSDPASGGAVPQPDTGYPAPSGGAARGRKPGVFSRRRGMAAGALLLLALGATSTVARAARPATARAWFATAASIVSPAQVVAGTGRDLRDPPWRAGFQ
ncbi:anti-sigma factor family protein [Amycolatopsis kentuckyensis]|uniref:anti-sigma factor family protein n=1 Tax=Amycolatopsis kentuckyensis TaxID=218823 RepID=UPI003564575A